MRAVIEKLLGGYERGRVTRRELIASLSAMAAATMVGPAAAVGSGPGAGIPAAHGSSGRGGSGGSRQAAPFRGRTLNHTTMFVADVERSVRFYQRLFGMPVRSTQDNGVNLALGEQNQFLGLYRAGSPDAADIHHICIGVDDFDPDQAMATLEDEGVTTGRIRMRGETPELYFTDPDGLSVQIQDVRYCGGGGELGDGCG